MRQDFTVKLHASSKNALTSGRIDSNLFAFRALYVHDNGGIIRKGFVFAQNFAPVKGARQDNSQKGPRVVRFRLFTGKVIKSRLGEGPVESIFIGSIQVPRKDVSDRKEKPTQLARASFELSDRDQILSARIQSPR